MTGRKPRLLLIGSLPPPYSGIETGNLNFINSGIDAEYELKVFDARTTRDPSTRGKTSIVQFASMTISLMRLVPVLISYRPEISVSFMPRNATGVLKWFAYLSLCRLAGSRSVVRFGGTDFDQFARNASPAMRSLLRYAFRRVDRFLIQGESLKKQFYPWIDEVRIGIQPNGFDLEAWRQDSGTERRAEKRASAPLKLLYLGQVSAAKGVLDILDALGELKRRGRLDDFEVTVAGPVIEKERNIVHIDNPDSTSRAISERLDQHGLVGRVNFIGEVGWDEKRALYRDADIFLHPSYSEGFPNAILEAGASNCAVICTPVGAIPDYFDDRREALLVPTGDSAGLANALEELCDDPALRSQLSAAIGRFVEEKHNFQAYAAAFSGHLKAASARSSR